MFRFLSKLSIKHLRKFSNVQPKPPKITIHDAFFGKYLFFTNTASSGVLMLIGDIIQQEIELRHVQVNKKYDYGRLTRMFLVGLAAGPLHHYYYNYLNKVLPRRDFNSITKKILLDQFVMSPICIAQFFYTIGLLEKKSLMHCNDEMIDKFAAVYLMDWCVWPPTQFINFYLVPVKYQVLYINAITTVYDVFLSYIKHKDLVESEKELSS